MKFENIDVIDALRRIMDIHTQNYKEDFDSDSRLIRELAVSESAFDKNLLWTSRRTGTHILREREVFLKGTYEHNAWKFYHEQTQEPILAYHVRIKRINGMTVIGDLTELDYNEAVKRIVESALDVATAVVTYEDGYIAYVPFQAYPIEASRIGATHGKTLSVAFLPRDEQELEALIRHEHVQKDYKAKAGNIDRHIRRLMTAEKEQNKKGEEKK